MDDLARQAEAAAAATQDELWLLGQPPLQKLLDYVEDLSLPGMTPDRASLIREWNAANDRYDKLEREEAGIADQCGCRELPSQMVQLAREVEQDTRFLRTFDSVPARIAMVELDRMVLCQNHVTRDYVEALKARLGPDPGEADLFRFCLPLQAPQAPVRIRRAGSRRFVFRSDSTDFRFHEPVLLQPEQLNGYAPFGTVAGVVGLVLGFSANFLNAIEDDDNKRLLLHNGYHRACALRELGITHAPCVIQTVTRRDELDIIAKENVADDPGFYFNAPRPPLLKDFYDPALSWIVRVGKLARTIEVSFEIRDTLIPE